MPEDLWIISRDNDINDVRSSIWQNKKTSNLAGFFQQGKHKSNLNEILESQTSGGRVKVRNRIPQNIIGSGVGNYSNKDACSI